ncbi:MAG: S24 family peptidase [Ktedonobacterales bacterium]|nr:S24 family peptidase [Ktedonobacterales bacterium]
MALAATFLLRVTGDSMAPGIMSGDILVVDCSLRPADYQVVVAVVAVMKE